MKKLLLALLLTATFAVAQQPSTLTPQLGPVTSTAGSPFNASLANTFLVTLSGNQASTVLTGGYAGQVITFSIAQNATGGFTIAAPTNVTGWPNVKLAASALTTFSLINLGNGTWTLFGTYASGVQTQYTNATTTMSNVPDWGWSIAASATLHVTCRLLWQNGTSNDAIQYQITGPASPTSVLVGLQSTGTVGGGASGATVVNKTAVAFASAVTQSLTTVTASTNFLDVLSFDVVNGTTAGTVQVQAAALTGGTIQIQAGSTCIAQAQ